MTSPNAPRAVVFDLDGLMFNTEELYQHVGAEMLRRRGKVYEKELVDAMMGRPAAAALQLMIDYHQLESTVAELSAETDEIFATLLDERLERMPGLVDLLDTLDTHGIPKAIATSSGPAFVERVLGQFDLRPRFHFVLTSADITHGKPHPEIYLLAAERFALAPGHMMVLEDSQNGCRAAIEAGAIAVAVPGGPSREHDFSGAALVAESLADRRIYQLLGVTT
ncbi:MAG: HAD family phosphatase [Planctomycetota bacterium]|nr:MAG: HAD family phosphatase [Planctomycetota bacterium]